MIKEEYLSWLGSSNSKEVSRFCDDVVKFSKIKKWEPYFHGCGLYAVGSSLQRDNWRDIDLVLVGLDFRAVFSYDGVFLEDGKTLLEKGLIVAKENAEWYPRGNEFMDITQFEYEGKEYLFNIHHPDVNWDSAGMLLNLYDYMRRTVSSTSLLKELSKKLNKRHYNSISDPFDPYDFEGIKVLAPKIDLDSRGLIDFRIHGENLTVSGWKSVQDLMSLPFIELQSWLPLLNPLERKIITKEELPRFIDSQGKMHATNHYFLPTGRAMRKFNFDEAFEDFNRQLRERGEEEIHP
jgi:hypothetical protein